VSKRCLSLPVISLALFVLAERAPAQFQSRVIRGEVRGSSDYSRLTAELFDESTHQMVSRQPLNWGGSFEFRTQPGNYQVRIATMQGDILQSAMVPSADVGTSITIDLPESTQARPIRGKVSVHDLSRQQNRQLMKEFATAEEAARRGDFRASIAHLQQVIGMDPKFAGAYVNLGTRYARLKLPSSARAAFLRAIELDPKLVIAYTNLAVTDLAFGDPEGAAEAATAALRLEPNDPLALQVIASAKRTAY
jgi:tetratricopeptide (TPR) repeat protein